MTNKNAALSVAKANKKDEFYTQLTDIEQELKHYRKHFKGTTVLCNCDDPFESNFFKYFVLNFNKLGLKKLIATSYATSPIAGTQFRYHIDENGQMTFTFGGNKDNTPLKKAYKAVVNTVYDKTGNDAVEMLDVAELFESGENELTELEGNGDFRSEECIKLLKETDIVVTNPPFSLFREYVEQLMEYNKKFIIIGNKNAITYKEIFPLLKENKMWIGYRNINADMWFIVPEGYQYEKIENGHKVKHIMGCWFTNLDIKKRHEELILVKRYNPEDYPKYDNYDAIEIGKTADIPCDYAEMMGVPITFMDKYCPEQFEIVGTISAPSDPDTLNLGVDYSKYIGYTQNREPNGRTGSTFGKCPAIVMDDKKHPYYEYNGIRVQTTYHRIFIRNKHPEKPRGTK